MAARSSLPLVRGGLWPQHDLPRGTPGAEFLLCGGGVGQRENPVDRGRDRAVRQEPEQVGQIVSMPRWK